MIRYRLLLLLLLLVSSLCLMLLLLLLSWRCCCYQCFRCYYVLINVVIVPTPLHKGLGVDLVTVEAEPAPSPPQILQPKSPEICSLRKTWNGSLTGPSSTWTT